MSLEAADKHFIKIAILLYLTLEHAKLELLSVQRLDVILALARARVDGGFVCLRDLIFLRDAGDYRLDLPPSILTRRLHLAFA
jgi:hypothetical protein